MATRAQNESLRRQARQKIAPELEMEDDPDVDLVETINILESERVIDLEEQVVAQLWRDYRDDESGEGSD